MTAEQGLDKSVVAAVGGVGAAIGASATTVIGGDPVLALFLTFSAGW